VFVSFSKNKTHTLMKGIYDDGSNR